MSQSVHAHCCLDVLVPDGVSLYAWTADGTSRLARSSDTRRVLVYAPAGAKLGVIGLPTDGELSGPALKDFWQLHPMAAPRAYSIDKYGDAVRAPEGAPLPGIPPADPELGALAELLPPLIAEATGVRVGAQAEAAINADGDHANERPSEPAPAGEAVPDIAAAASRPAEGPRKVGAVHPAEPLEPSGESFEQPEPPSEAFQQLGERFDPAERTREPFEPSGHSRDSSLGAGVSGPAEPAGLTGTAEARRSAGAAPQAIRVLTLPWEPDVRVVVLPIGSESPRIQVAAIDGEAHIHAFPDSQFAVAGIPRDGEPTAEWFREHPAYLPETYRVNPAGFVHPRPSLRHRLELGVNTSSLEAPWTTLFAVAQEARQQMAIENAVESGNLAEELVRTGDWPELVRRREGHLYGRIPLRGGEGPDSLAVISARAESQGGVGAVWCVQDGAPAALYLAAGEAYLIVPHGTNSAAIDAARARHVPLPRRARGVRVHPDGSTSVLTTGERERAWEEGRILPRASGLPPARVSVQADAAKVPAEAAPETVGHEQPLNLAADNSPATLPVLPEAASEAPGVPEEFETPEAFEVPQASGPLDVSGSSNPAPVREEVPADSPPVPAEPPFAEMQGDPLMPPWFSEPWEPGEPDMSAPQPDGPEGDWGPGPDDSYEPEAAVHAPSGRSGRQTGSPFRRKGGGSGSGSPECPVCQGAMWDNREKKLSPRSPDFRCKDKACKGVVWPNRSERGGEGRGGASGRAREAWARPEGDAARSTAQSTTRAGSHDAAFEENEEPARDDASEHWNHAAETEAASSASEGEDALGVLQWHSALDGPVNANTWMLHGFKGDLWVSELTRVVVDSEQEIADAGCLVPLQLMKRGFALGRTDRYNIQRFLAGPMRERLRSVRVFMVGGRTYFARQAGMGLRIIGPRGALVRTGAVADAIRASYEAQDQTMGRGAEEQAKPKADRKRARIAR